MNEKEFNHWKNQALTKLDKSFIGSIDKPIENLCNTINFRKDMFTLSSCSGRICIIAKNSKEKTRNCWIFTSHDKVDSNDIWNILENYNDYKNLEFRQESAIIHICVKTLDLARKLMDLGKICGFNQVGIIALKNKIVVELICDIQYIIPIHDGKKLHVDFKFIDYIIDKSNKNMEYSWKSIDRIEEKLKNLIDL